MTNEGGQTAALLFSVGAPLAAPIFFQKNFHAHQDTPKKKWRNCVI